MSLFSRLVDESNLPTYSKRIDILSPISGAVKNLDEVDQPLFQQRLFGEGVAIDTSGYQLFSPFDAKVLEFKETAHRIVVKDKHGLRVQIQFGAASHKLFGESFKRKVRVGEIVKQGQILLEFDPRKLRLALECPIFFVTLLNSDKVRGVSLKRQKVSAGEDILFSVFI
ncbi:PTS glucose transporter subunit IIA [Aliiglaciecola sp. LCG003]|uniref:PTS sugar transporter subunit IIA n=1 Tax=Aliiglaciecola sp. LCG003 TaxID=3053655 RepID=UPI002573C725|nr:PTS glucose transporter subunit IIA [Aliiglaciecola sp. LCG003]WJG07981.1 PTS glucose transporter subunit IIA [Aliiglaciecola sp. LCG003]